MAEQYKKILPGNWVTHLNAWPAPTSDFVKNKRVSGDPSDRLQQAVLTMPGWLAVHKVGYVHIARQALPPAAGGVVGYDITIPSPDTRADDKPRADVNGLLIPKGAILYRVGLRIPSITQQPGFFSSGAKDPLVPPSSGLLANAGSHIWLEAGAAPPTAPPGGTGGVTGDPIQADSAHTSGVAVGASGEFEPDQLSFSVKAGDVITTADMSLKLYAENGGLATDLLGGVYVVAEVCYLAEDAVADLDALPLPGATIGGTRG